MLPPPDEATNSLDVLAKKKVHFYFPEAKNFFGRVRAGHDVQQHPFGSNKYLAPRRAQLEGAALLVQTCGLLTHAFSRRAGLWHAVRLRLAASAHARRGYCVAAVGVSFKAAVRCGTETVLGASNVHFFGRARTNK